MMTWAAWKGESGGQGGRGGGGASYLPVFVMTTMGRGTGRVRGEGNKVTVTDILPVLVSDCLYSHTSLSPDVQPSKAS